MQISTGCTSGCVCPDGLVSDGAGGCINETSCPCVHSGQLYQPGESLTVDCNTWCVHSYSHTHTHTHAGTGIEARGIESVCLVGVPTATAPSASSYAPATSATRSVGSMGTVTTPHLTTRGLTSTGSVNTHSCRYVGHAPLCSE